MNDVDGRLTEMCRKQGLDGILLRRRSNIAWIAGGANSTCNAFSDGGVASIVWMPDRKIVLTDHIDGPRLEAEEFGDDWEFCQRDWWESESIPPGNFATDIPVDCLVDIRASLNDAQLTTIRELGCETGEVLESALRNCRPGDTELQLAADLTYELTRRAIQTPVILIGADDRIARFRHPIPTQRRGQRMFMAVVCARRKGLTVAATRIVHFGNLPSDLRRIHDATCRIDETYHAATQPAVRWCDALSAGIDAYRQLGFENEWRLHFQGGPMGFETRDYWATPTETRCIVENQAVGWNPSITGTKSEDTILSTGEVITATGDWPTCGTRPDILVRPAVMVGT